MPELRHLSLNCQPVNCVKVTIVNQIVVDDTIWNRYAMLVHQLPLTQSTLWRLNQKTVDASGHDQKLLLEKLVC